MRGEGVRIGMRRFIRSFLDNDSLFGRISTQLGIMIGASLMFAVFSLPVVTIGPALAALYFVMLRALRSDDGVVNPFREFWRGFKLSFKQGLISWLILAALVIVGYFDLRFCRWKGGALLYFQYAIYVIGAACAVLAVHFYPVLSAFEDTLPHLLRNSVFFAGKNIFRAIVLVALWAVPITITVLDPSMFPLYGFLWTTIGTGAIAMVSAKLLLKDFSKYLPALPNPAEEDEFEGGGGADT